HNTEDKDSYWFLDPDKYSSSVTLFNIGGENSLVLKFPYLRRSYQSKKSVTVVIAEALPNTAVLAFTSMIFALIVGVTIGIFAALHRNKFFDRFSLVSAVAGMSLPSFFAAILAAWIFAFLLADITGLSMYGSLYGVDDFGEGEYMDLRNLILPALTLGIRPLAVIIQLTRNSLLEELSSDYVRTAKSKGLSTRKVVLRHALKNAMNPVITTFSGWLASLLAGAVFIEYIFDWKGIGVVIVNGLEKYDFPIVMGCVLTVSVILIIITILVDILYAWLDPRVRLQ
ncbi:MAG: ABC transporter permease, partial [Bacteroidota bacterium]